MDMQQIEYDRARGIEFSYDCRVLQKYPYDLPDESYAIPRGVSEIGEYAFSGCENLLSVVIPDGVVKIWKSAFNDCGNLESVTIPGSVAEIGEHAFWECKKLQSVEIADGVKKIGNRAFKECESLESVTIPGSVKKIGDVAFSECESLRSVEIADGVGKIGEFAFSECESLESVTIPGSVKKIGLGAFQKCESLRSITFVGEVPEIDSCAFDECDELEEVFVPGDSEIDDDLFPAGCRIVRRGPECGDGEADADTDGDDEDDVDEDGGETIFYDVDAETVLEFMDARGYCVDLTEDNSIRWKLDDDAVAFILFDDGARRNTDIGFFCGYNVDAKEGDDERLKDILLRSNDYNAGTKFGKSYVLFKSSVPVSVYFGLPLNLEGGITEDRFEAFFANCVELVADWKEMVVDNL